jgi:CRISPR-associated protein Cas1
MPYIPLKPLPIKDRLSIIFIGKTNLDVINGAFVMVDAKREEKIHIPIGSIACILLEPGTRISHSAVKLAAEVGTLLVWVGEGGVRFYASGQPGGARSDKLLYQAKIALDDQLRLKVVRKMFELRFNEAAPARRSVEQLRGIEGARVKAIYKKLADKYSVQWNGRRFDVGHFEKSDIPNQCISAATSCLYAITEAAILAAGYAPSIGFVHSGKPLSFVYDIADIIKFDTVVPIAFEVASTNPSNPSRAVRLACREEFRTNKTLRDLIPLINDVLSSACIELPVTSVDIQPVAFPDPITISDEGFR